MQHAISHKTLMQSCGPQRSPGQPCMMVRMYVRDPHTSKPAHDLLDLGQAKAASELAEGALPAVQQHAPAMEAVDVDGGDIAILGGHGSPRAQEHHLQLLFSCLWACTALCFSSGLWSTLSFLAQSPTPFETGRQNKRKKDGKKARKRLMDEHLSHELCVMALPAHLMDWWYRPQAVENRTTTAGGVCRMAWSQQKVKVNGNCAQDMLAGSNTVCK